MGSPGGALRNGNRCENSNFGRPQSSRETAAKRSPHAAHGATTSPGRPPMALMARHAAGQRPQRAWARCKPTTSSEKLLWVSSRPFFGRNGCEWKPMAWAGVVKLGQLAPLIHPSAPTKFQDHHYCRSRFTLARCEVGCVIRSIRMPPNCLRSKLSQFQ